jgi:hypothetical protein
MAKHCSFSIERFIYVYKTLGLNFCERVSIEEIAFSLTTGHHFGSKTIESMLVWIQLGFVDFLVYCTFAMKDGKTPLSGSFFVNKKIDRYMVKTKVQQVLANEMAKKDLETFDKDTRQPYVLCPGFKTQIDTT